MKICFNARPYYDDISTRLYSALSEQYSGEIEGVFITVDEYESAGIKKRMPGADVRQMNLSVKEHWSSSSIELLQMYEDKYDCTPIWEYIYTDRFLINMPTDFIIKTVCGMFAFYEEVFVNKSINYYYDETIATMQSYVAYFVAKKCGAHYLSQMLARGLDGTHHYILDDPFQLNCNFDESYKSKLYSKDIADQAEALLSEFETKDLKPEYMATTGTTPHFSIHFFKLPFAYVKGRLCKKYNDRYAYLYFKQYKSTLNPIRYYTNYLRSKKYYKKAELSHKYVLFPLHYQPEASTCVCAQKYEKQLFYIDSLAKSLPADSLLYLKEHYAVLGHRELQFYKELSKYPNVVLISPFENTRNLIKNAQAVTTLTGTVGWEAMLLRKPVFIGGHIFYQNAPGVTHVDDIYEQYERIINSYVRPSREDVIQYLCEYISTIRKGTTVFSAKAYNSPDNFYDLANSFIMQTELWRNLH